MPQTKAMVVVAVVIAHVFMHISTGKVVKGQFGTDCAWSKNLLSILKIVEMQLWYWRTPKALCSDNSLPSYLQI